MNYRSVWQITVTTTAEAADATTNLLERLFPVAASTYTDAETQATTVSVCVPDRLNPARRSDLGNGLEFVRKCGLDAGAAKIQCRRVRRADWSESWKKHFKTIEIGTSLLIKPSWSRHRPRKNQVVVILDPGLSFGTGQHPTTLFCLRQLVAAHHPGTDQSFLDIGTGSGILAIAAIKLGYTRVRAFDFDPVAVRVARANALRNRVNRRLSITRTDLTKLPRASRQQYDLVCANLIDDLLVAEAGNILKRLKPTGRLVLAGILTTQFARVRRTFERLGWRLIASRVEREWQSGAFAATNPR